MSSIRLSTSRGFYQLLRPFDLSADAKTQQQPNLLLWLGLKNVFPFVLSVNIVFSVFCLRSSLSVSVLSFISLHLSVLLHPASVSLFIHTVACVNISVCMLVCLSLPACLLASVYLLKLTVIRHSVCVYELRGIGRSPGSQRFPPKWHRSCICCLVHPLAGAASAPTDSSTSDVEWRHRWGVVIDCQCDNKTPDMHRLG